MTNSETRKISYVEHKKIKADTGLAYMSVLIFFLISPFLSLAFSCLGLIFSKKNLNPYILGVALSIGGLSVAFVPGTTSDLVRYFEMLDNCFGKDFAFVNAYFHDGLYVKNFMFWLVSQSGCYGLLSGITTGAVYYIAMYITVKTAEKYEMIGMGKLVILIQIAVLPYISIVNNIRNVFAFSIIALAAFRDICLKKRGPLTWIFYLAPCFFHASAVVVLLMRILAPLCKRFIILIVIITIFIVPAINFLYISVDLIPVEVLQRLIIKAHAYLNDAATSWGMEVANSSWEKTVKLVFMVLMACYAVISFLYFWKRRKEKRNQTDKYIGLVFLLVLLSLVCGVIFTTPAYWRFSAVVNVIVGAMIIPIVKSLTNRTKKLVLGGIGIISLACLLLQLYRLPYMVDIVPWVFNSSYTGGLYILIQILL